MKSQNNSDMRCHGVLYVALQAPWFCYCSLCWKNCAFCPSRSFVSTVVLTLFARGVLRAHVLLTWFYFYRLGIDQSYQYPKFRNCADPNCKHAAVRIPYLNNWHLASWLNAAPWLSENEDNNFVTNPQFQYEFEVSSLFKDFAKPVPVQPKHKSPFKLDLLIQNTESTHAMVSFLHPLCICW